MIGGNALNFSGSNSVTVGGNSNVVSTRSDSVTVGGYGNIFFGVTGSDGSVVVGGAFNAGITMTSLAKGSVAIGGVFNSTVNIQNQGTVLVGGFNNISTFQGQGFVSVGGSSGTSLILGGQGGVNIGGQRQTLIHNSEGGVSICAGGTFGTTGDRNSVLIGGTGTTLIGSDSVCIGPSSLQVRFGPTGPKLYLKENPITLLQSPGGTTGATTLTANAVIKGYIGVTGAGTVTFPSVDNMRNEVLDTTASAFSVTTSRPSFNVYLFNTSAGTVTMAAGASGTMRGLATIATGVARHVMGVFTSASQMDWVSLT
jgi:hypothetical protein